MEKKVEFENFMLKFQKSGLGPDACIQAYDDDETIKYYEQASKILGYSGPRYCAAMLTALITDKENALLLDLAAGSGFVGEELKDRGYRHIHALDGAAAMLEACKQKGLYSKYIHCFIQEGVQLPISNDTYDAVTMSGASCDNHIPPSCQEEIVRITKSGGYFVNVYRSTLSDSEYGQRWEAEAKRLVSENKWTFRGRLFFKKLNLYSDGNLDIYRIN